jgi:hypothetical protein
LALCIFAGRLQGTYIDSQHSDVERLIANIRNQRMTPREQRKQLDLVRALNEEHAAQRAHDAPLEAAWPPLNWPTACKVKQPMRSTSRESDPMREAYGGGTHGRQLLITRRLLERGVRFVQVWSGAGQPWDNHENLEKDHRKLAGDWDQPIAAFLLDLKQRGLFEDTLVLWSGEFGRTPVAELPALSGRDHNHYGFSVWLAGGGIKGGTVYGATDEFGFRAVEAPVHVHDLHATILHLLGLDHERLTYRYSGRDFRLTDVAGNVVKGILA